MSEFQFMSHSISPMRFFCNRQSGIKRHHNSDMETFASRFRNRRNHLGLSQKELAAKANVSQTTISDIERGRNDASRELLSLARALQVNPDWLQSGIGDMDNSLQAHLKASSTVTGKLTDSNAEPAPTLGTARKVPVVGTAQLGDNHYWAEFEAPTGHGDGYVIAWVKDLNAYAIRCRGDSMQPRVKDGEFVLIAPNQEVKPGDEVLVKHCDGRVMVKTFLYERDGRIHLLSVNEAHPPQSFPRDQVERFSPVIGILKSAMWVAE